MDNVIHGILLEPLLARGSIFPTRLGFADAVEAPFLKDSESILAVIQTKLMIDYQADCISYASRHMSALGTDSASGLMGIRDEKKRSEGVSAWWMLSLSDGFRSAFNRLRPILYA